MIEYTTEIAEAICVKIASGETLEEISRETGFPARGTVYRWLARYPKFYDAYERAREVSAQSLEEEALLMARNLKNANDFSGTKVQAYNIAMQQLRWSASRRDKARYGQQMPTAAPLMIQINSSLNLDPAVQANDVAKSVYTIEAIVVPTKSETDEAPDVDTDEDIEDNGDQDELAFAPADRGANALVERKPRRKAGHKSPNDALNTARAYARKEARKAAKAKGSG